MKIIVPIAGRGARFAGCGAEMPKPLRTVTGQPMLMWAMQSLKSMNASEIIFVTLQDHLDRYPVAELIRQTVGPNAIIVAIPEVTEGQLCTVLAAREHLEGDEDILIASSDTFVVSALAQDIDARHSDCRGIISVIDLPGDQWSFARTDSAGRVLEVAEKRRISSHASTGLYYFAAGCEFLQAADALLHAGVKTRGEYYVMPVYEWYLVRGKHIAIAQACAMHDLGTPESLHRFEQHLMGESG